MVRLALQALRKRVELRDSMHLTCGGGKAHFADAELGMHHGMRSPFPTQMPVWIFCHFVSFLIMHPCHRPIEVEHSFFVAGL